MRVYLNGHVGACAPRQPQWQHWGELAEVGQDADSTARVTGVAPREGVCGCDDEDATERAEQQAADADACMAGGYSGGGSGGRWWLR